MADFDFTIRGGQWSAQGWATNDPVTPKLGYGGHPIGARPKRKGLTVYEGRQPFQLEVPMLLYRGGLSVEQDRIALESMATSEGKLLEHGAPGVKIEAEFPLPIPPPLARDPKLEWWIEDLDWKDELRNPPEGSGIPTNTGGIVASELSVPGVGFVRVAPPQQGGHLIRKLVTVTLLEKVAEEFLGQQKNSSKGRSRRHQVKLVSATFSVSGNVKRTGRAETLHEIAAHELGDSKRWKEIADLNHIRSDGQLKVGQWLNLPDGGHSKAKHSSKHHK